MAEGEKKGWPPFLSGQKAEEEGEEGTMPLRGHLSELRKRLIICIVFFLAGFLIGLYNAPRIVTLLTDMGTQYNYKYVFIAPQELIMVYFSVAFWCGVITGIPAIAVEVYGFAKPGLYEREKKAFRFTLLFGTLCFVIGVLFAYKITLPFMLYFLIKLRIGVDVTASISIQSYVSFLLTVFLIFGVIFELPVVSVVFTLVGILKPEYLVKARKAVIVGIFLIAAVITPPDILSQIMVAVPMIGLYELSIVLCRLFTKRKKAQEEEEEEKEKDGDL